MSRMIWIRENFMIRLKFSFLNLITLTFPKEEKMKPAGALIIKALNFKAFKWIFSQNELLLINFIC